jgi:PIN domain nuclease of toxin-antitoxin system
VKVTYLVDTHVLLWAARDNSELGKQTRRVLENSPSVYYSAISIAEVSIKEILGKLRIAHRLTEALNDQGFLKLGFNNQHALEISRFESLAGHDPFDRLILAQAASEGFKLITADKTLLALGFDWVLDARD